MIKNAITRVFGWKRASLLNEGIFYSNPEQIPSVEPDVPGVIALTSTAVNVDEGQNFNVTASRSEGSDGAVAVDYTITDVTTTPQTGTLNWGAGATGTQSASVLASLVESTTQGTITLSNPRRTDGGSPAPTLGVSSGTLTVNEVVQPPSGDNAARLIAARNVHAEAWPSILTGIQYPADPVTTTTHEVRNNTELADAVSGNGRLVRIFGPSNGGLASYNQFSLNNRSDIDIVMDNDATIAGPGGWAWFLPVRRLRWTGGNIQALSGTSEGLRISDAEDVMFDNVRMYKSGGGEGHVFYPGTVNLRRFAVINSTIEILPQIATLDYAIISSADAATSGDYFFINNRFRGHSSPTRQQGLGSRVALVGNFYHYTNLGVAGSVRIHGDPGQTANVWFAHNLVLGTGNQPPVSFIVSSQGANTNAVLSNFLVESNRVWHTQSELNAGIIWRLGDTVASNRSQATGFVITGNRWLDDTGPAGGEPLSGYFFDVPFTESNNLRVGPGHVDYEAVPAFTNFGAIR